MTEQLNAQAEPSKAWQPDGREARLAALQSDAAGESWDLVIVGGGITGAGILREAVRQGLKAILVERRDFAWGTSSRSSKMVHGGLRYLAQGAFRLTRDSVRERQRLLHEVPGLVEPLNYLMPHYPGQFPGPGLFQLVLSLYDRIGGKKRHTRHPADAASSLIPGLRTDGLKALSQFTDAVTDDARLVLRVLQEAIGQGGVALNYTAAAGLLKSNGRVKGVRLQDELSGKYFELPAHAVINATGAWTDELRAQIGGEHRIRPLRGSHLVIPFWRLPLAFSLSFFHPQDRRPVFAFPWEGMTVIGTTDLDHEDLNQEARITTTEVDYLLAGVNSQFPQLNLGPEDVTSTYAGIRPVIGTGATDPSKEKREHAIWDEQGLISVAGGKLTTFRLIALHALSTAAPYLPSRDPVNPPRRAPESDTRIFSPVPGGLLDEYALSSEKKQRLLGRFGVLAKQVLEESAPAEREPVATTDTLWAELRWSCRHEAVVHLEDLLLRRTRLGLLLPRGGEDQFERLGHLCRETLAWSEERWQAEVADYRRLWVECYSLPQVAVEPEVKS